MRRAIKIDPVDLAPRDRRRIGDEFTASYEIAYPRYVTHVYRWDGSRWQRMPDRESGFRDGCWFEDK